MKRRAADRAVYEGACIWVEYGISVRSATLAESIAIRNQQAKDREPLAVAELANTHYSGKTDWNLVSAANEFVAQGA